jgi:hypothetical protein
MPPEHRVRQFFVFEIFPGLLPLHEKDGISIERKRSIEALSIQLSAISSRPVD